MRTNACIALVGAMIVLTACSSEARRVGATAPTVTYSYRTAAELREAKNEADDWCDEHYSGQARPAERWSGTSGEVTFLCVAN